MCPKFGILDLSFWNNLGAWKWMVRILISFWDGLFLGAMLVSRSVIYKQSANSLHFDVETVLSQVFDFPQLWLCCKSCQAICRRWWSLGLPSPIGAKHVGKWRWRWTGSRFEKRKSTSAEKQKKTGSGYMSFLKVEEFLNFDDLMCCLLRFFLLFTFNLFSRARGSAGSAWITLDQWTINGTSLTLLLLSGCAFKNACVPAALGKVLPFTL